MKRQYNIAYEHESPPPEVLNLEQRRQRQRQSLSNSSYASQSQHHYYNYYDDQQLQPTRSVVIQNPSHSAAPAPALLPLDTSVQERMLQLRGAPYYQHQLQSDNNFNPSPMNVQNWEPNDNVLAAAHQHHQQQLQHNQMYNNMYLNSLSPTAPTAPNNSNDNVIPWMQQQLQRGQPNNMMNNSSFPMPPYTNSYNMNMYPLSQPEDSHPFLPPISPNALHNSNIATGMPMNHHFYFVSNDGTLAGDQTDDIPHFSKRKYICLGTESDDIWLSDFLVFLRSECIEVFKAKEFHLTERKTSKKIRMDQVGLRCRFCAHLPYRLRVVRSSCFPSTIQRIYQSITMMIREHFPRCQEMPEEIRDRYNEFRWTAKKGDIESKSYWVESALAKGFMDTESGIEIGGPIELIDPEEATSLISVSLSNLS